MFCKQELDDQARLHGKRSLLVISKFKIKNFKKNANLRKIKLNNLQNFENKIRYIFDYPKSYRIMKIYFLRFHLKISGFKNLII